MVDVKVKWLYKRLSFEVTKDKPTRGRSILINTKRGEADIRTLCFVLFLKHLETESRDLTTSLTRERFCCAVSLTEFSLMRSVYRYRVHAVSAGWELGIIQTGVLYTHVG